MPGRRDLDGAAAERLAPHVGQIGREPGAGPVCAEAGTAGQSAWPRRTATRSPKRGRTSHLGPAHQCRLADVAEGHDQAARRSGVGQGDHARDMAQRAVQPELPAEGEALGAARTQLACGDEQPDRDREVESGTALPHCRKARG